MAKFNYVLSFNPTTQSPNPQQLHVLISQNRDIESWYLAFPGTYVLKSEKLLAELNVPFQHFFGSSPYIFTFAQIASGSLPPQVWDWFNSTQSPFLTNR